MIESFGSTFLDEATDLFYLDRNYDRMMASAARSNVKNSAILFGIQEKLPELLAAIASVNSSLNPLDLNLKAHRYSDRQGKKICSLHVDSSSIEYKKFITAIPAKRIKSSDFSSAMSCYKEFKEVLSYVGTKSGATCFGVMEFELQKIHEKNHITGKVSTVSCLQPHMHILSTKKLKAKDFPEYFFGDINVDSLCAARPLVNKNIKPGTAKRIVNYLFKPLKTSNVWKFTDEVTGKPIGQKKYNTKTPPSYLIRLNIEYLLNKTEITDTIICTDDLKITKTGIVTTKELLLARQKKIEKREQLEIIKQRFAERKESRKLKKLSDQERKALAEQKKLQAELKANLKAALKRKATITPVYSTVFAVDFSTPSFNSYAGTGFQQTDLFDPEAL